MVTPEPINAQIRRTNQSTDRKSISSRCRFPLLEARFLCIIEVMEPRKGDVWVTKVFIYGILKGHKEREGEGSV